MENDYFLHIEFSPLVAITPDGSDTTLLLVSGETISQTITVTNNEKISAIVSPNATGLGTARLSNTSPYYVFVSIDAEPNVAQDNKRKIIKPWSDILVAVAQNSKVSCRFVKVNVNHAG